MDTSVKASSMLLGQARFEGLCHPGFTLKALPLFAEAAALHSSVSFQ